PTQASQRATRVAVCWNRDVVCDQRGGGGGTRARSRSQSGGPELERVSEFWRWPGRRSPQASGVEAKPADGLLGPLGGAEDADGDAGLFGESDEQVDPGGDRDGQTEPEQAPRRAGRPLSGSG